MSLSLSAAKLCKRSAPDGLHHLDYRESFRPDTISHYSKLQVSRCELLNQTSIWDCQENMAESHLGNITTGTVNLLRQAKAEGIVELQMSPPICRRIVKNNMEAIRNQEILKWSVIKSMLLTFKDIWIISCNFSSVMWCHRGSWHQHQCLVLRLVCWQNGEVTRPMHHCLLPEGKELFCFIKL